MAVLDFYCLLHHSFGKIQFEYAFIMCIVFIKIYIHRMTVSLPIFATLFSFGSFISFMSTFILVGPVQQFQSITSEHRFFPTIFYSFSMVFTLVAALYPGIWFRSILVLIFVFIQFISLIWYTISYFPSLKQSLSKFIKFIL